MRSSISSLSDFVAKVNWDHYSMPHDGHYNADGGTGIRHSSMDFFPGSLCEIYFLQVI